MMRVISTLYLKNIGSSFGKPPCFDGLPELIHEIGNALMYRAAALLNLRIPQDLSVVGWEFAYVSQFLNPPLSTLALDRKTICREVVDLLERLLRKEPVAEDLHLPFHYIGRESVAPPAR